MIQSITNMLRIAYFSQTKIDNRSTKNFRKQKHPKIQKHSLKRSMKNRINNQLIQVCNLIKSEQRCQNWIILLENYKQNYVIKYQLFNAILEGTVNVHNLFLMLIQCRVLPEDVWIPIQALCKLKGDRDNQLCCLIHFTVMNMGKKYKQINNPDKWSRQKALKQMGQNFVRVYNHNGITLQQKIAILPMLIVLNNKNSFTLWEQLKWLHNFPFAIIVNLRSNMRRLIDQRVSVVASTPNPDYFTSKMCIKSIQLLEVQGFVSAKNLFVYAYELYNLSLVLSLLAHYQPPYDASFDKNNSFRLQLIDFILQLFDCIQAYEYDFEMGDANNNDISSLRQIIVKNKLYTQELNNIRFNQQIQRLIQKYQQKSKIKTNKRSGNLKPSIQQSYASNNCDDSFVIQQASKTIQIWIRSNQFFNKGISFGFNFGPPKNTHQQNNQETNQMSPCENSNLPTATCNIAKIIPRCSSLQYFKSPTIFPGRSQNTNMRQNQQQEYDQDDIDDQLRLTPQKPEQRIKKFCTQRQQTILTHILSQLYRLKTDYLQILHAILVDCYSNENYLSNSHMNTSSSSTDNKHLYINEQPWSQISSCYYKLQIYLIKNHLLQFLIYNFNSLQTNNNPVTMICYYNSIGLLLKNNPISYGKVDQILAFIQQEMSKPKQANNVSELRSNRSTNTKSQRSNMNLSPPSKKLSSPAHIQYFYNSFINNIGLSKQTILMILSDQFEWIENETQGYPNSCYESFLVKKIIDDRKVELMVKIVQNICCLCNIDEVNIDETPTDHKHDPSQANKIDNSRNKQGSFEVENEKFGWVTLLLAIYYYYEQTVETLQKNRKMSVGTGAKRNEKPISTGRGVYGKQAQRHSINAPNRAYLDKLLQKQKFMEQLYPIKINIVIGFQYKYQYKFNSHLQQNTDVLLQQLLCRQEQGQQPIVIPILAPIYKNQRVLNILAQILDKWEQFYNRSSKKTIISHCLSYPMLKVFKKKLKNRILAFVKIKQYEECGEEFYYRTLRT